SDVAARPQAVVTLETGWTEIFTTDSLTLRCEVQGISAEWNYTWYRDGEQIPLDHSGERYTVRSGIDSYQSEYKCRGSQGEGPLSSSISEGYKTKNIVVKRKVLVSLSGCLFLGVAIALLACIGLQVSQKTGAKREPGNDLFFAQPNLESRTPQDEYSSDRECPAVTNDIGDSAVLGDSEYNSAGEPKHHYEAYIDQPLDPLSRRFVSFRGPFAESPQQSESMEMDTAVSSF
ncbi:hypothetical protein AAFF_G00213880, partial [Aldrovandia affinis]